MWTWDIDDTPTCAICGRRVIKEYVICERCRLQQKRSVNDWIDIMNRSWEALRDAMDDGYDLLDEEEYVKDDPISFDELMES